MKKFLLLLLLLGCSPNCPEDFHAEGEAKTRQLVKILERVETKQDLIHAKFVIRKKITEIVDLMNAVKHFEEKHPTATPIGPNRYSAELLKQLKKIYAIDGGRDLLEIIEREPLIRLN